MRIVLLEGHALYREAVGQLLEKLSEGTVVRQSATLPEAVALYAEQGTMDLAVIGTDPGRDGALEAVRSFRHHDPAARVAVIMRATGPTQSVLQQEGVACCIPCTASGRMFHAALRQALGARPPMRRHDRYARPVRNLSLTRRQRQILDLMGHGMRNRDMGVLLGVSEGTVKVHVSAIYRTLDVENRVQALAAARRMGLVA